MNEYREPQTLRDTLGAPVISPSARIPVWDRLARLYFQRFPLLLAGLLVLYVPFALRIVPAMFRSTLVMSSGTGLAVVAAFAVIAAIIVLTTRRTILLCGPDRFGVKWRPPSDRLRAGEFVGHALYALPIVLASASLTATEGHLGWMPALLAVALGILVALVFLGVAAAIYAWLTDQAATLPDVALPRTAQLFVHFHQRSVPEGWLATQAMRLARWIRPRVGPGYFTASGAVLPPHLWATGITIAFAGFYAGAYFIGHPQYGLGVPALVYVLILATLVTLGLSGVAFGLDRHHVPTLLPIVGYAIAVAIVSNSDHYFTMKPIDSALVLQTPGQIARNRPLLTIVAVDGGGIQAAAWGATVLTHLEDAWPEFHKSVALISSISGGSVGTMYFMAALTSDNADRTAALSRARQNAREPSLSEAAWGFAYPDLWRVLIPVRFTYFEKDRAWAMEQAWRRRLPRPIPTLQMWANDVRTRALPAVSLNATTVESGQRFSFATFAPPSARDLGGLREWSLDTFATRYQNQDIDVATAARLSATFPYVTPVSAASPDTQQAKWHYADGGYYDNTGMGIAMRWLDAALVADKEEYRNHAVAFIEIRSSPPSKPAAATERAWSYETVGPILTELHMRSSAQSERAATEFEFLKRLWCDDNVEIRRFEFGFDLPAEHPGQAEFKSPPLSWQLTSSEAADIDTAWNRTENQRALAGYLALQHAPSASCPNSTQTASTYRSQ